MEDGMEEELVDITQLQKQVLEEAAQLI